MIQFIIPNKTANFWLIPWPCEKILDAPWRRMGTDRRGGIELATTDRQRSEKVNKLISWYNICIYIHIEISK